MQHFYSIRLLLVAFFTSGLIISGVITPLLVSAQESCGNIVEIDGNDRLEEPIQDCVNPYGVPHLNPDLTMQFGNTVLEEDDEYTFVGESRTWTFNNVRSTADGVDATLYLHEGQDRIITQFFSVGDSFEFTTPGTYTLVVDEWQLMISQNTVRGWLTRLLSKLIPIAHAFHGPALILTFSVTEAEPEPEIDPLILEYEPVLYLHPDENYQPMNIEAFVEASALWDDAGALPDELVKAESSTDPVTIADISTPDDTSDWYLSFSGEGEPKIFDTSLALNKYNQLVDDEKAVLTYYARRMEDSFIDDEGTEYEYIVLQYWYFYAFNDWDDHGGLNNHEGDWESVMVFLDKDTQDPLYVAYSQHHNDDDPDFNIAQYDSVRRNWNGNEVVKDDGQIVSFVALGSHANYPNNGDGGIHPIVQDLLNDLTSQTGSQLQPGDWGEQVSMTNSIPPWINYEGRWGADANDITGGESGPKGPNFIDVGGTKRFHNPIEWAGIDKITERTIASPINTVPFADQLATMTFDELLAAGTTILVDLHDEIISFGDNLETITLLPHFWDLESNLANDTFEVTVELQYDEDELEPFDIEEDDLSVFLFNEDTGSWEDVESFLNPNANTISFTSTHLSRYAIGADETKPTKKHPHGFPKPFGSNSYHKGYQAYGKTYFSHSFFGRPHYKGTRNKFPQRGLFFHY